jgi:hypothetical protein
MIRVAVAALGLAVACAGAGESVAPDPSPFRGVRSLALVRSAEDRGRRPKDPLDALRESLEARGFTTRTVELGDHPPAELAAVERLFAQLELRAATGRQERLAHPVSSLGRDARAAVAGLGVDAVASYHRLDRTRPQALPPATAPGTLFPAPAPAPDRPTGALVLVDREGRAATFAWGDSGAFDDPAVPLNAAEAIELLVRALAGDPPDG